MLRAHAELSLCLGACPAELARDCRTWSDEVEPQLARLLVMVDVGPDISSWTLTVDELARTAEVPIWLRPGKHRVVVSAAGVAAERREVLLVAGQQQVVRISVVGAKPLDASPTWVGPVVLGSTGAVILTVSGALSLLGHIDVAQMRDPESGCAPLCPALRVDEVRTLWISSGILAAAGGAAVVASAIWGGVSAPPADEASRASWAWSLSLDPSRRQLGVTVSGSFE